MTQYAHRVTPSLLFDSPWMLVQVHNEDKVRKKGSNVRGLGFFLASVDLCMCD